MSPTATRCAPRSTVVVTSLRQWSRAADEIAAALRSSADRYQDADAYAAGGWGRPSRSPRTSTSLHDWPRAAPPSRTCSTMCGRVISSAISTRPDAAPAQLRDWYGTEDGMDLGALHGDCLALEAAVRPRRMRWRVQDRQLSRAVSGVAGRGRGRVPGLPASARRSLRAVAAARCAPRQKRWSRCGRSSGGRSARRSMPSSRVEDRTKAHVRIGLPLPRRSRQARGTARRPRSWSIRR